MGFLLVFSLLFWFVRMFVCIRLVWCLRCFLLMCGVYYCLFVYCSL